MPQKSSQIDLISFTDFGSSWSQISRHVLVINSHKSTKINGSWLKVTEWFHNPAILWLDFFYRIWAKLVDGSSHAHAHPQHPKRHRCVAGLLKTYTLLTVYIQVCKFSSIVTDKDIIIILLFIDIIYNGKYSGTFPRYLDSWFAWTTTTVEDGH